jgi:AhpD family alkylhydroperoxidase
MSETVTETSIANDPRVVELVALAAAVGSNCEACFRSHYETARGVGLSNEEIVRAVSVAEAVKATPARRIRELAAKKLDVPVTALTGDTLTAAAAGDPDELTGDCGCGPAGQAEPPAPAAAECC